MKTAASIALIGSLLFASGAAARLCQFGYADAVNVRNGAPTLGWVGARNAGVPQDSGRIIPLDDGTVEAHTRDIRSYIQAMNANGIRPLVDLSDVLFSPDLLVNTNCGADYERGNLRSTWKLDHQAFKPGAEAKLASFLALNSSELGTDKPDPKIFQRALKLMNLNPDQVLHVGDDPERDWKAARGAGLSVFQLDRPRNSLRDLLTTLSL